MAASDDFLLAYLELNAKFSNSKVWKDRQLVANYKKNPKKFDWQDEPVLLLVEPVSVATNIYSGVKSGKLNLRKETSRIKELAGRTWYALDCRRDVNDGVSNVNVAISKTVKEILAKNCNIVAQPVLINKDFLRDVSACVWEKLGGSK